MEGRFGLVNLVSQAQPLAVPRGGAGAGAREGAGANAAAGARHGGDIRTPCSHS